MQPNLRLSRMRLPVTITSSKIENLVVENNTKIIEVKVSHVENLSIQNQNASLVKYNSACFVHNENINGQCITREMPEDTSDQFSMQDALDNFQELKSIMVNFRKAQDISMLQGFDTAYVSLTCPLSCSKPLVPNTNFQELNLIDCKILSDLYFEQLSFEKVNLSNLFGIGRLYFKDGCITCFNIDNLFVQVYIIKQQVDLLYFTNSNFGYLLNDNSDIMALSYTNTSGTPMPCETILDPELVDTSLLQLSYEKQLLSNLKLIDICDLSICNFSPFANKQLDKLQFKNCRILSCYFPERFTTESFILEDCFVDCSLVLISLSPSILLFKNLAGFGSIDLSDMKELDQLFVNNVSLNTFLLNFCSMETSFTNQNLRLLEISEETQLGIVQNISCQGILKGSENRIQDYSSQSLVVNKQNFDLSTLSKQYYNQIILQFSDIVNQFQQTVFVSLFIIRDCQIVQNLVFQNVNISIIKLVRVQSDSEIVIHKLDLVELDIIQMKTKVIIDQSSVKVLQIDDTQLDFINIDHLSIIGHYDVIAGIPPIVVAPVTQVEPRQQPKQPSPPIQSSNLQKPVTPNSRQDNNSAQSSSKQAQFKNIYQQLPVPDKLKAMVTYGCLNPQYKLFQETRGSQVIMGYKDENNKRQGLVISYENSGKHQQFIFSDDQHIFETTVQSADIQVVTAVYAGRQVECHCVITNGLKNNVGVIRTEKKVIICSFLNDQLVRCYLKSQGSGSIVTRCLTSLDKQKDSPLPSFQNIFPSGVLTKISETSIILEQFADGTTNKTTISYEGDGDLFLQKHGFGIIQTSMAKKSYIFQNNDIVQNVSFEFTDGTFITFDKKVERNIYHGNLYDGTKKFSTGELFKGYLTDDGNPIKGSLQFKNHVYEFGKEIYISLPVSDQIWRMMPFMKIHPKDQQFKDEVQGQPTIIYFKNENDQLNGLRFIIQDNRVQQEVYYNGDRLCSINIGAIKFGSFQKESEIVFSPHNEEDTETMIGVVHYHDSKFHRSIQLQTNKAKSKRQIFKLMVIKDEQIWVVHRQFAQKFTDPSIGNFPDGVLGVVETLQTEKEGVVIRQIGYCDREARQLGTQYKFISNQNGFQKILLAKNSEIPTYTNTNENTQTFVEIKNQIMQIKEDENKDNLLLNQIMSELDQPVRPNIIMKEQIVISRMPYNFQQYSTEFNYLYDSIIIDNIQFIQQFENVQILSLEVRNTDLSNIIVQIDSAIEKIQFIDCIGVKSQPLQHLEKFYINQLKNDIKLRRVDWQFYYNFLEKIGSGGFGKVYRVKQKTDQKVFAMKLIDISKNSKYKDKEIEALRKVQHPHIIGIKEFFETQNELAIVMDFADNGDLDSYLKSQDMSPRTIWSILAQVMLAVARCHCCDVIHRDLKPDNMLISESLTIKYKEFGIPVFVLLGDFGIAGFQNEESKIQEEDQAICRSLFVPEMIRGEPQTIAMDSWQLGVSLYKMLTKHFPYHNREELQKSMQMHAKDPKFIDTLVIPEKYQEFKPLLQLLLVEDYTQRVRIIDIVKDKQFSQLQKEIEILNKMHKMNLLDMLDQSYTPKSQPQAIPVPKTNTSSPIPTNPGFPQIAMQSSLDNSIKSQPKVSEPPKPKSPPKAQDSGKHVIPQNLNRSGSFGATVQQTNKQVQFQVDPKLVEKYAVQEKSPAPVSPQTETQQVIQSQSVPITAQSQFSVPQILPQLSQNQQQHQHAPYQQPQIQPIIIQMPMQQQPAPSSVSNFQCAEESCGIQLIQVSEIKPSAKLSSKIIKKQTFEELLEQNRNQETITLYSDCTEDVCQLQGLVLTKLSVSAQLVMEKPISRLAYIKVFQMYHCLQNSVLDLCKFVKCEVLELEGVDGEGTLNFNKMRLNELLINDCGVKMNFDNAYIKQLTVQNCHLGIIMVGGRNAFVKLQHSENCCGDVPPWLSLPSPLSDSSQQQQQVTVPQPPAIQQQQEIQVEQPRLISGLDLQETKVKPRKLKQQQNDDLF